MSPSCSLPIWSFAETVYVLDSFYEAPRPEADGCDRAGCNQRLPHLAVGIRSRGGGRPKDELDVGVHADEVHRDPPGHAPGLDRASVQLPKGEEPDDQAYQASEECPSQGRF